MDSAAKEAGVSSETIFADLGEGMAGSILEQAAKYAEGILDPINRGGDLTPATLVNGEVTRMGRCLPGLD